MKQLLGLFTVGLGALGVVGSFVALIALWIARRRMSRSAKEALRAAQAALVVLDDQLRQAHEAVGRVKELVEPVVKSMVRLGDQGEGTSSEDASALAQKERELGRRLLQAEMFVPFCQAAVMLANKTSTLARAMPLGRLLGPIGETPFGDLATASATLADVSGRLQQLGGTLLVIREAQEAKAASIALAVGLAGEVEPRLTSLEGQLVRVRARVAAFPLEAANLQGRVRFWLQSAALIGSALLLWIGLAQAALVQRGLTLIQP